MKGYTKAELECIIMLQMENLNAMNDLVSIIKKQNELMVIANKKLTEEITAFNKKHYTYTVRKTKERQ